MAGTDAARIDMNRLINSKFAACLVPVTQSVSATAHFSEVPEHILWLNAQRVKQIYKSIWLCRTQRQEKGWYENAPRYTQISITPGDRVVILTSS